MRRSTHGSTTTTPGSTDSADCLSFPRRVTFLPPVVTVHGHLAERAHEPQNIQQGTAEFPRKEDLNRTVFTSPFGVPCWIFCGSLPVRSPFPVNAYPRSGTGQIIAFPPCADTVRVLHYAATNVEKPSQSRQLTRTDPSRHGDFVSVSHSAPTAHRYHRVPAWSTREAGVVPDGCGNDCKRNRRQSRLAARPRASAMYPREGTASVSD